MWFGFWYSLTSFHKKSDHALSYEKFEDIEGVTRTRKSKKNRQHNGQMKKYNYDQQNIHIKLRSSNINPTNNLGWTHVLRKGKGFLLQ